jgi:hypothetical protein
MRLAHTDASVGQPETHRALKGIRIKLRTGEPLATGRPRGRVPTEAAHAALLSVSRGPPRQHGCQGVRRVIGRIAAVGQIPQFSREALWPGRLVVQRLAVADEFAPGSNPAAE